MVGRANYRVAVAVLFHDFVPAFRVAFVGRDLSDCFLFFW